jgi:hypothetical protein
LTVAVKALPEPVADRNPVTVLRRLPALSIPWANDDSLPAGIHPELSWQKWLGAWQNDRGGFSVNNVGAQSAFSFFDDARLDFRPSRAARREKTAPAKTRRIGNSSLLANSLLTSWASSRLGP